MLLYSLILFAAAILFLGLGVAIYRGRTDLIHAYHRTKVADPEAYGKDFGKALLVFAAAMLLSGILALLGDSGALGMTAVAVLVIGLGIGTVCLLIVQKKHNRGIF